jgi:multiple sugar transport system substrate-binding protein
MFNQTEHPDAAWKFISFLGSAESQSFWNKNIGQMPTRSDLMEEEWVQNAQHIKAVLSAMNEEGSVTVSKPSHLPGYLDIRTEVAQPGFQEVLAGETTPKEFLDEWSAAWMEAKEEYETLLEEGEL